jgi:hypothetical protein
LFEKKLVSSHLFLTSKKLYFTGPQQEHCKMHCSICAVIDCSCKYRTIATVNCPLGRKRFYKIHLEKRKKAFTWIAQIEREGEKEERVRGRERRESEREGKIGECIIAGNPY